jgi:hypothetical protein
VQDFNVLDRPNRRDIYADGVEALGNELEERLSYFSETNHYNFLTIRIFCHGL